MPIASDCTKHFVTGFTDEAGGHANTQLFCSVKAIFSLLPAPDPPLRILTLGVLIVSGGALAALPFRRYQALPDASSAPAQVTGPMQGILEHSVLDSNASATVASHGSVNQEYVDSSANDLQSFAPTYPAPHHPRRLQVEQNPRRANIPLTFEDLQVPIDLPDPVKHRFSATTPIRAEQLELERVAGMIMPELETLAESQIQEIQSVATRFAESAKLEAQEQQRADNVNVSARVTGSLTSSRPTALDKLPKETHTDRDRHWIRQPD